MVPQGMKIAVVTVIYPGVEPYLKEFLSSLSGQTYKAFDVYMINDGLPQLDFYRLNGLRIQVKEAGGSPALLRKAVVNWAIDKGSDVIIFADSDDYFQKDRVKVSVQLLEQYDIVVNELVVVGEQVKTPFSMLGEHFREGQEITKSDIFEKNCMGLSNTAIRSGKLSSFLGLIPNGIIAFDWALFSFCLNKGASAVFTKRTWTFYRQHLNNIASPRNFSNQEILRALRIKKFHYKFLSQYFREYKSLAVKFDRVLRLVEKDQAFADEYCRNIRAQALNDPLWWEGIRTLEDLGL